jgi:uncharacterized protein YqfB (UPF0267 family)
LAETNLDILPNFFEDILFDRKTFEVRKDKPNRNFSIGDILVLSEVNEEPFQNIKTGRVMKVEVTYISSYIPGYKILQIRKV